MLTFISLFLSIYMLQFNFSILTDLPAVQIGKDEKMNISEDEYFS